MRSVVSCGCVVLATLLAGAPHPARAMAGDVAPPPDSLVALALSRAPSLAALRARVQEARELVRPAGALPNPMLEVMLQDVGFPRWTVGEAEMSMIGPQISQAIPFPGKRGARRRVAESQVVVREHELELLRREVARELRSDYARLYALDRERQTLRAAHELLGLLAATVRDRYSAGLAEGEATIKVQLTQTRIAERLDDLTAERKGVVATIDRLLDGPGDAAIGEVDSLPAPSVPPMPWAGAVLEGSVGVSMRRAELETAERRLRVARGERLPDLVAGAGVGLRGEMDPVVTLRLGMELPLWSGQNQGPMIRAAAHDREAARQLLREAEAGARAEAARLEADWTRAQLQIARYAQAIVPQSSLAFDAARSSYLAGRGDFSTVIEDLNLWLEARSGLAAREAERYTTWAELKASIAPGDAASDARGTR